MGRAGSPKAIIALGCALFAFLPQPSAAKGRQPTFPAQYVPIGAEVQGRRTVPDPARFLSSRGYLVPADEWNREEIYTIRTVPLPDLSLRAASDRLLVIRFTVRRVPAGRYRVILCSSEVPCRWRERQPFTAGALTVIAEPTDVGLWRSLDRLRSRVTELRGEVEYWSARSFGDQRWHVYQSRLAEVQLKVAALSRRLETVETAGSGLPRGVAAAFPIAAFLLIVAARRRGRRWPAEGRTG